MEMSPAEKITVMLLCEIHKSLKIKDGLNSDLIAKAIASGNMWGIQHQYAGLFEISNPPQEVVREVSDILEMWFRLEYSYSLLSDDHKNLVRKNSYLGEREVYFRGFDGNNETDHMGVARFLIDDLDTFAHFKGRGMNSHMPSIDAYRRMWDAFEPIFRATSGKPLSHEQIVAVLNEQVHPANRTKPAE